MRRTWWGYVVVTVLVAAGCGGGSGGAGDRAGHEGADHRGRIEAGDPDRGHEGRNKNPNATAYQDRAYPKRYVSARQTLAAHHAYQRLPRRLGRADFRPAARAKAAAAAAVGVDWDFIGPDVGFAPGPTTESLRDSITSGRVTGMAIDPNCGAGGHGCRVWVAAAGGGIWRTSEALAAAPTWAAVDTGLPTNNLGSVVEDPNDASGDTLYAGTGEANAINEAGLGLYKTTDGGDHWSLVPGSFAVAHDRSIGAVRVDPTDPDTIWMGTADGRQGQSSVNGGTAVPPGAPPLGVYVSHDGGGTFTRAFALPEELNPGFEEDGGGTDIELDPQHPDRVYASLLDGGAWRTAAALESGPDAGHWKQVYAPTGALFDRTELAVAVKNGKTRLYAADGGFDQDFNATGELFRVDDANKPAATLLGAGDNAGWTKLSSPDNGTPGFAAYQLCQFQCDYDLFLDVDPTNPDVVWFGGSMVYEEIRPLQDQTLQGIAPWRSNGRAVMRSEDAGVHFTDMTADTEGKLEPGAHHYEQMHPDQHAIAFDPVDTSIAFVGSDGGVVRTDGAFSDMSAECDDPAREIEAPEDLADCKQWLKKVPHRIVNMNDGLADLQFVQLVADPSDPLGD